MLSSVLRSERAVQVNIQIMQAFVQLRELMLTHLELARKLDEVEKKFRQHEQHFTVVRRDPPAAGAANRGKEIADRISQLARSEL